ncbi:MAG: ROK family protein [Proteobacteria bacterium]|nr:ROK family protein [Pseudomonadota bacterium]
MDILGVDVGGTGIKAAPVDIATGQLRTERIRLLTPRPATPDAVAGTIAELVTHFQHTGPIGCGFPAVIRWGQVFTAANIDKSWIGTDAQHLFERTTGCPFQILNDADAAGLAEMRVGAGKGRMGTVLVVTLGTGIGTALFVDGNLVPNTELGHIEIKGRDAETWAAESVREQKRLTWKKWTRRLDRYLRAMHAYLWPELIIIGGGASKRHDRFIPNLTVDTEVVPAQLRNEAGIIGAALGGAERGLSSSGATAALQLADAAGSQG